MSPVLPVWMESALLRNGSETFIPLSLLCSFPAMARHMMDCVASNSTVLYDIWEN